MTESVPPSGTQHEIRQGAQRAVVTEVGATLRSYAIGDVEVLDGFSVSEMSPDGRGQVLAPWPNRLDGGSFRFEGREGHAALDKPDEGNAIHGLVRWLPWRRLQQSESEIELGCTLHPQPGYPWRIELRIGYRLDPTGLTVSARATNAEREPAPFGIGFHPYVGVGTPFVDDVTLTIPAQRHLVADDRGLPTGDRKTVGGPFDFTTPRRIGETQLDAAYTALAVDDEGRANVSLESPDGERGITLWMDGAFGYVMAYTGDQVESATRRRRAIALEPMTCPPNALRTGNDLIRLEPDAYWEGAWGITPRP
jgi:aldose 1-epimerase